MKRASLWRNLLIWVVVIACLAMFMQPRRTVRSEAFEDGLTVESESGYVIDIAYEDVTAIELREDFDYGTLIDGVDEKKEKSGVWENEELGQYRLCVNAGIPSCIILHTESGSLVINYESDRSTQSLYEAMLEQIR